GEGNVAEEWPGFVFLDEAQCPIGADVDDITFRADHAPVLFEWRVQVFAPVPGRVTKVLVEAARHRMIRPLAAVVPFSERARGITRRLEGIDESFFFEVQPLLS